MTGDIIDAKEADRIGLVNKVVPLKELMSTAKELASRLAHGPTLAIGWTKRSVNKRIKQDLNLLMDAVSLTEQITFSTEDHKEAARAFVEKRKPQFKGK
jgi:enoyl-CoA hydratase/carnithine racemase